MFGGKGNWPLLIESLMSGVEISFTILVDKNGNFQILPTAMDYPERFEGPAGKKNPITCRTFGRLSNGKNTPQRNTIGRRKKLERVMASNTSRTPTEMRSPMNAKANADNSRQTTRSIQLDMVKPKTAKLTNITNTPIETPITELPAALPKISVFMPRGAKRSPKGLEAGLSRRPRFPVRQRLQLR